MKGIFRFFASLKLAVFSILTLAGVLAAGTILESLFGTRAAGLMIYGTWWFGGVLLMLGSNVLCAALSRYPWKRRQMGFVVTHAGILTMLAGSFITQQFGVDGNLPVVEGNQESDVILPVPRLLIAEEDRPDRGEFPVPESARFKQGRLLHINLGNKDSLLVDRFIPRAVAERVVRPSPIPGVGDPAIRVEIFNSRFRVEEWLFNQTPEKPTDLNLGPAILSFRKLWTPADENAFFHPPKPKPQKSRAGFLVVQYRGQDQKLNLDEMIKKGWKSVPNTNLEVRVERYLPYAIVDKKELVNKNDQPVNPAVQLEVRDGHGVSERHTIFANFPEFATLHGAHQKGDATLGVKFRMYSAAQAGQQELAIVGSKRGQLQFAQSRDNRQLHYRVLAADGRLNSEGTIEVGKEVMTGWMDLTFKITTWHPAAVDTMVPRSVDYISGESNFLSSLHILPQSGRDVAADSGGDAGQWLMEGDAKSVAVGDRKLVVQYSKQRLSLPFSIFLEKFTMGTDPGTTKAATYESQVTVKDPAAGGEKRALISMNEPLVYGGYTFYQASYQLEEGRPPVSVFSVNYDPGRKIKYLGALLIVLGALMMFYMNPHYIDKIFPRKKVA